MPVVDVAVQDVILPRAQGLEEVRPVAGAFALGDRGFGKRFLLPPTKRLPRVTADFEPAFRAVKKISDFLTRAAFVVRVAAARLQLDDFSVGVGVGGHLRVRRLLRSLVVAVGLDIAIHTLAGRLDGLVLREAKHSARRIDRDRVLVFPHPPARDVQLVRPGVAGVAIARIPIPMPIVVAAFFIVGAQRCGPEPAVVMKRGRWGARLRHSIRITRLEAERARHEELANPATMEKRHRLAHILRRAVVQSDLHTPIILAARFDHFPTFPNVMRRRLLDVDVLARLTRPDRRERVPVIRHDNRDGMHVLVVEHRAQVPMRRRLLLGFFRDQFQSGREECLVSIAQGAEVDVVAILQSAITVEVHGALIAEPDHREVDSLVGAGDGRVGFC